MNRIAVFLTLIALFIVGPLFGQNEGRVSGSVFDQYNQPIDQVVITVLENTNTATSKPDGLYDLKVPSGDTIHLRFRHLAYRDTVVTLYLQKNEKVRVNVIMPAVGEMLPEFSLTSNYNDAYTHIDPKLSFQLPSPTGGIESLIKMLPGASSVNELSSQYNVRGGNYDENLIYVNDIQIYRPFLVRSGQQEGLSFVNMDLTNNVKFSAGGFEAKYGDKMSSVLDVEYKKPTSYGGSFSAGMLGGSLHAQGNVKDKFTFLVGMRYKANTYLLKSLETSGEYKPRFFDTQMLLTWKPAEKWELSLLGNFSKNQYRFVPSSRLTTFGSIEQAQQLEVYFDGQEVDQYENYLGALTVAFKPNFKNMYKLIVSSYYAKESETYDIRGEYWLKDVEIDMGVAKLVEGSTRGVGAYHEHARNHIQAVVSAADLRGEHQLFRNTLLWGVKVQNEIINDRINEWTMKDSAGYTVPFHFTTPGEPVPAGDPSRDLNFGYYLLSANNLNTMRLTGFVQDSWRIDGDSATRFVLNGGVRFHYWTYNNEVVVSPRLLFTYTPRWKHKWVFRLNTGMYYQPPFYREMRYVTGELNPKIRSQRSYQVVASAGYDFKMWRRPFKFTTEVYYKYMDRLIPYTVNDIKVIYSAENNAHGYAAGIDMKLSGEFIEGLESWITLSLMKTAEDIEGDYYIDKEGNKVYPGYIPRPTDQRFALNVFFQDHIPSVPQLRVHLNLVFSSPLPYGAPNAPKYLHTLRSTWYRRVDLGFSYMFLEQSRDRMKHKSKFIKSIKNAGIFVEVFNLLDIKNTSSFFWVSDIYNTYYPVPNYLTPRLLNVKLAVEF